MRRPGRGSDQFALRLPDGLRDRIKEAADQNRRSMNSEIVTILEMAVFDPLKMEKPAAQS
jgi:predicted HicB family RNase H-like nuclease